MKVGDAEIGSYRDMPLLLTDTGTTLTHFVGETYDRVIEAICHKRNCFTSLRFLKGATIVDHCKIEEFEPIQL